MAPQWLCCHKWQSPYVVCDFHCLPYRFIIGCRSGCMLVAKCTAVNIILSSYICHSWTAEKQFVQLCWSRATVLALRLPSILCISLLTKTFSQSSMLGIIFCCQTVWYIRTLYTTLEFICTYLGLHVLQTRTCQLQHVSFFLWKQRKNYYKFRTGWPSETMNKSFGHSCPCHRKCTENCFLCMQQIHSMEEIPKIYEIGKS